MHRLFVIPSSFFGITGEITDSIAGYSAMRITASAGHGKRPLIMFDVANKVDANMLLSLLMSPGTTAMINTIDTDLAPDELPPLHDPARGEAIARNAQAIQDRLANKVFRDKVQAFVIKIGKSLTWNDRDKGYDEWADLADELGLKITDFTGE